MSRFDADLIVVGSGPAGAQAAKKAVELGLSVMTVDVGAGDRGLAESIPPKPFSELRRTDPGQARYFIGDIDEDDVTGVKAGAQITPPRKHVVRGAAELLPIESDTFAPVASVAEGGLGAAWGAGSPTFTRAESASAGLDFDTLRPLYDEVAQDIGISGELSGDIAPNMAAFDALQPPVAIDDNAASILRAYEGRRAALNARGFRLGRLPIAMLSQPLDHGGFARAANALHDMEMYADAGRSVYRPWYTIAALRDEPRYRYVPGMLALHFEQHEDGVDLTCRDIAGARFVTYRAPRIVLAAGAINTARLALHALGAHGTRRPLLCNPYRYLPALNLRMLGRRARDARHSLAQLAASLAADPMDPAQAYVSFYSYRSLLLYRLVAQMPFPPYLGLLAARVMLSALTLAGVHFADRPTAAKWLAVRPPRGDAAPVIEAAYALDAAEVRTIAARIRELRAALRMLGLLPLTLVDPGHGSSIHYAGTLPSSATPARLCTAPDGRLWDAPRVFVADSAAWRFLPAKGPTLTIMAQARAVAGAAVHDLRAAQT